MSRMLAEARRLIGERQVSEGDLDPQGGVSAAEAVAAYLAERRLGFEPFFEFSGGAWHVYWGGFDYDIEDEILATPERVLGVLSHLSEKRWELMTIRRVGKFVEAVSALRGWKIH